MSYYWYVASLESATGLSIILSHHLGSPEKIALHVNSKKHLVNLFSCLQNYKMNAFVKGQSNVKFELGENMGTKQSKLVFLKAQ